MTRGLLLWSVRQTMVTFAIVAAGLLFMEALMSAVLPSVVTDMYEQLLQIPFLRTVFQALLGTDVGDLGPEAIVAISWVHPVVLAIVFAHPIVHCTRMPAGEIDRGTIDVLLGLPVTRWRVLLAETVVFLVTAAGLLALALLGFVLGVGSAEAVHRPAMGRLLIVVANLYCLCVAVGGLASLVSAVSDHRGRAIATVFGILLASFLLSFLAQLWAPADAASFLSLLTYYQPLAVIKPGSAAWPLGDMIVLVIFGAATWTAGGLWLARRDICTV